MATTYTTINSTQTSDSVIESNVPPVPPNSVTVTPNQNRLIQYVRSVPLISLLFGRNVPSGQLQNEPNRLFIFKTLMIFHLIILVTLIGLTTFTIYYYNIRFYKSQTRPSETLIVCWLLRAIWHTINSSWSLKYYVTNPSHRHNLRLSQTFYNVASILWIGLTVLFLGLSPREDLKSASARICYFLLWITIASYVVPMLAYTVICVLLYITLLALIFFRHGSISLYTLGVPPQLLKKLKVERYKEVIKMIQLSKLYSSGSVDKLKDDLVSKDDTPNQSLSPNSKGTKHIESQTTLNSMREGVSDCVNNDDMLNDRLCSICMLNIKDDDKVYILPCDIRHLFHRVCLNKWFKRSSECPICRSNITEMLTEKKEVVKESTTNEEEINSQDQSSDNSMIEVVIDNSNNSCNNNTGSTNNIEDNISNNYMQNNLEDEDNINKLGIFKDLSESISQYSSVSELELEFDLDTYLDLECGQMEYRDEELESELELERLILNKDENVNENGNEIYNNDQLVGKDNVDLNKEDDIDGDCNYTSIEDISNTANLEDEDEDDNNSNDTTCKSELSEVNNNLDEVVNEKMDDSEQVYDQPEHQPSQPSQVDVDIEVKDNTINESSEQLHSNNEENNETTS